MLSKPLLATLLACAPSGAIAFGDLDCVGVEYCSATGCAPSADVFSVAFDWRASAAHVAFGTNDPIRLSLITPDVSPDGTSGQLAYRQPDVEDGAAMVLAFFGERIEASLTLGLTLGGAATHTGLCAAREAA